MNLQKESRREEGFEILANQSIIDEAYIISQ